MGIQLYRNRPRPRRRSAIKMEIEINGKKYQNAKLTPMQQFHVMRKLTPVLTAMSESASDTLLTQLGGSDLLAALAPCMEVISSMSVEDSEFVLNTCLSSVSRQDGAAGGWQKIQVQSQSGQYSMMFSDIDLDAMLRLTGMVIKDNLGNFFNALPIG